MNASYEMENKLRARGHSVVVGADEVGRGALAGPLVCAVAVLPAGCELKLRDSKKIARGKRAALARDILDCALDYGIGLADTTEIDRFGLSIALRLAYIRALEMLDGSFSIVILDGAHNVIGEDFVVCRIKADDTVACVAAASILAKVYRDELMTNLASQFPQYGFGSHVGYGSAKHIDAILTNGPSDIHRRSFKLKKLS